MSTLAGGNSRRVSRPHWGGFSAPLPAAALASRLLVLTAAVLGATLTHRVADWQHGDPQHLTLKLGALGNVLAAAAVRWDSVHYLAIAQHGYATAPNVPFFPLYPLIIRGLTPVTGSYVVSGIVVSACAFAAALTLLFQLVTDELGQRVATATVLLVAFSPVSLFFTAVYTESLFLAFSLGAFLLARRGRFGLAGLAAAGATLTHVEGVLLIAPLAILYWQDQRDWLRPRRSVAHARRLAVGAMPLLLPVAALAAFLLYLHSQGFGWLAPFSDERYYAHHFTGPVVGIAQGASAGVSGLAQIVSGMVTGAPGGLASRQQAFLNFLSLVVLVICVVTLVIAWRRLPKAYAVYGALSLLTCVSSPVRGAPLTSLDRYALVLFPLWIAAAAWLDERRLMRPAVAFNMALMLVFSFEFARWVFIG